MDNTGSGSYAAVGRWNIDVDIVNNNNPTLISNYVKRTIQTVSPTSHCGSNRRSDDREQWVAAGSMSDPQTVNVRWEAERLGTSPVSPPDILWQQSERQMTDYQRASWYDDRLPSSTHGTANTRENLHDINRRSLEGGNDVGQTQEERMLNWMIHERLGSLEPPTIKGANGGYSTTLGDGSDTWKHDGKGLMEERSTAVRDKTDEQRFKERMDEWKMRDGPDPDSAEFERLRTPPVAAIEDELSEILYRRVIIIEGLTMDELSHPQLLEAMAHSNEFRMSFVFKENPGFAASGKIPSVWEGIMFMFMGSSHDASEATKHIKNIREDLKVRAMLPDENLSQIMDGWRDNMKTWMRRLSDDVMIVTQLTNEITEDDIHNLFPDALDVVIPRGHHNTVSSEMLTQKGYAFLTFGSRARMLDAYSRYSARRLTINSHHVRVIKYEPPKEIPMGFLRLRRRFRILSLIRDLKRAEAFVLPDARSLLQKIKKHQEEWQSRIESDNFIRKSLGVPAPSIDELYLLLNIQKLSETPLVEPQQVAEILNTSKFEQTQLKEMRQMRKAKLTGSLLRRQFHPKKRHLNDKLPLAHETGDSAMQQQVSSDTTDWTADPQSPQWDKDRITSNTLTKRHSPAASTSFRGGYSSSRRRGGRGSWTRFASSSRRFSRRR